MWRSRLHGTLLKTQGAEIERTHALMFENERLPVLTGQELLDQCFRLTECRLKQADSSRLARKGARKFEQVCPALRATHSPHCDICFVFAVGQGSVPARSSAEAF